MPSINSVAVALNVDLKEVAHLCEEGLIAFTTGKDGSFYVSNVGVAEIIYFLVTRHCQHCFKRIPQSSKQIRHCTTRCRQRASDLRSRIRRAQPGFVSSRFKPKELSEWQLELGCVLASHRIPANEVWVDPVKARAISSLSYQEFSDLRDRKILLVSPNKDGEWAGRPLDMFATSELKVVKRFMEHWRTANNEAA